MERESIRQLFHSTEQPAPLFIALHAILAPHSFKLQIEILASLTFSAIVFLQVEFREVYGFADEHTKRCFDEQRNHFYYSHKHRDRHMDTKEVWYPAKLNCLKKVFNPWLNICKQTFFSSVG